MAFIVQISFKFWPSAAATGHVILASGVREMRWVGHVTCVYSEF